MAATNSTPDTKYECLRGFIMAPSPTNGEYVPFFVKVRAKDIIWDDSSLPGGLVNISRETSDFQAYNPTAKLKFTYNGWNVIASADYSYEATKRIKIVGDNSFAIEDGDDTDLFGRIAFPFVTENNGEFSLSATINSSCEDLTTATVSFLNLYSFNEGMISGAEIHLKNLIYHFDNEFEYNQAYIDSSLFVTVKGVMNIM